MNFYSEELKNKRKTYVCYACNRRSVKWHQGKWQCKTHRCGWQHSTVDRIENDRPRQDKKISNQKTLNFA